MVYLSPMGEGRKENEENSQQKERERRKIRSTNVSRFVHFVQKFMAESTEHSSAFPPRSNYRSIVYN